MTDIDKLMERFCDAGADAVRRHCRISGIGPSEMPEYFMPAFIMNHLGDNLTATLETTCRTLVEWNTDTRSRRMITEEARDKELLLLAERLRSRRVDMVLYDGEAAGISKAQQDIFALIEFKGGWIDTAVIPGRMSDRDKLILLLAIIDTCPWGIVCGWIPQAHLDWQRATIKETDDRWFEKKIELPEFFPAPLFFCARLFSRTSNEGRLKSLLQDFKNAVPAHEN